MRSKGGGGGSRLAASVTPGLLTEARRPSRQPRGFRPSRSYRQTSYRSRRSPRADRFAAASPAASAGVVSSSLRGVPSGLSRSMHDGALETDDFIHQLVQFEDRNILTATQIDMVVPGIVP